MTQTYLVYKQFEYHTYDDYGTILTVERLPFGTRELNMRLQVRTNELEGGSVNFKNVQFLVDGDSGPFRVTSQSESTSWNSQSTQTITWDVANTDQSPINCTNIDIFLSTDAGRNFNTLIAENISNNGSHDITVPIMASMDSCRIMVKASDNIFFDINNAYISIVNSQIPDLSLSVNEIVVESIPENNLETEFIISNNGQSGSVLSFQLNFIDSIYIDEDFENLELDNSLSTT